MLINHSKLWLWNGNDSNHIVNVMSSTFFHLFPWTTIGVVGLRHISFPNLNVGGHPMLSGTWKCDWMLQLVTIVVSLQQTDRATIEIRRPKASTPPPLLNWYLHSTTKFWALYVHWMDILSYCHPHNVWCHHGKNQNKYSTFLVAHNIFMNPLYVRANVPCLSILTLTLYTKSF